MKRSQLIETLVKEGFSEKTLANFTDKQITVLSERIIGEQPTMGKGSVVMKKGSNPLEVKKITDTGINVELREKLIGNQKKLDKNHNGKIDGQDFKIMKGQKKQKKEVKEGDYFEKRKEDAKSWLEKNKEGMKICKDCGKVKSKCECKNDDEKINEEKPSAGLSKEKKSEVVKKAKKGMDIGKKGKGFEKIEKKAKESGAKNPKAVAAAAMWKNVKRESKEKNSVLEWVDSLVENNYHSFTSKNEIMELIQVKLNENNPAPSQPKPDAPVREKPTTKPGKPKRENPFEPKHTPKPKALSEEDNETEKLPEFLKFKKLGIKFKDSN